tara:strand:+ start:158 stop:568 length:411 start_codon:yes stop_codon:yes gene_type:complete
MAAALCETRGSRLTSIRRQILQLLWECGRPVGAYDVLEALKRDSGRTVGPPTVYRALEFLMAEGLAAKIESRNAYVPCAHPERGAEGLFFICSDCGTSSEIQDPRIESLLTENAKSLGYRVERRVVEVEGVCSGCD